MLFLLLVVFMVMTARAVSAAAGCKSCFNVTIPVTVNATFYEVSTFLKQFISSSLTFQEFHSQTLL